MTQEAMKQAQATNIDHLPVIVLGSGGHAKVVIDTLHELNYRILGVTVRNAVMTGTQILGEEILGTDSVVSDHKNDTVTLANAVGSVSTPSTRMELYERFVEQGYRFISMIHPLAYVAPSVNIGFGTQVFVGAVVQSGTEIGNNTIINSNATVDHDCNIASHVHIGPGAVLCGAVTIGRGVHVGAGAVIREGMSIGANSSIAAGAVVWKDVPPNTRVAGDPARRV